MRRFIAAFPFHCKRHVFCSEKLTTEEPRTNRHVQKAAINRRTPKSRERRPVNGPDNLASAESSVPGVNASLLHTSQG